MRTTRILAIAMILWLFATYAYTQKITVLSKYAKEPVPNVFIINATQNYTALTNDKGEAIIGAQSGRDTLVFQHPSYQNRRLAFEEIQSQRYIVSLEKSSIPLDEVVISASRWEQNLSEVPNKVVTLDPEAIEFENPQTAADALEQTNQVFVQKSQLGGGSPMIRGFAANSVLIVVDGVRMNNAIYRGGNLQNVISLDSYSMAGMEVIFGPGSVIYGSDALGGVMDFHTKRPIPSYSDSVYKKGNSFLRFSTANNENTGHIDMNFGFKKWAFLTSVTASKFGNLRTGSYRPKYEDFGKRPEYVDIIDEKDTILENDDVNIQKFSGYDQVNALQKIRYAASESLDIMYGLHFSTTSDIPRYDRLVQYKDSLLKYAKWYYGPQKWMMHNLRIEHNEITKVYDHARIVAAYQDYEESRHDRKFKNDWLRHRTEYVDVISLNMDFDKAHSKKHTTYYGLEAVYNKVDSEAEEENIETGNIQPVATRYPGKGSDYTTLAAYISHKYNMNKLFTFTSGARYSYIKTKSEFLGDFYDFSFNSIESTFDAINGSFGAVFHPGMEWNINLVGSSGFRAPNVDDIAKVFDSEPGNVVVPNENLEPEYAYNIDLGIEKRFDDFMKIGVTGYYTWLRDAIVRRDFTFNGQDSIMYDGKMSKVRAQVNAGKAFIYGVSGNILVSLTRNMNFYSYLTYTEGEEEETNEPLRHIAPLFGSSGIKYQYNSFKMEVYSRYNGKKPYSDLSSSEREKTYMYTEYGSPAWYTLNVKWGYKLGDHVGMNAGVENILDRHYRPYSSGISAPGRNFIVSLKAYM